MSGMDVKPPHKTMENDVKEVPVVTETNTTEEVTEVVPVEPGSKTESSKLLESLKEEREKRRQAEAKTAEKEAELLALKNSPETEVFSDEGKILLTRISKLESQLVSKEEKDLLNSVQSKYPALKDKQEEFEQFRLDNPGMKVETQAKVFLVENDLLEAPQARKGLEKASGGGRIPIKTGVTEEEKLKLMMDNPRKFREMSKSGQLK